MFTGIVEEMGRVAELDVREGATRFEIDCKRVLDGTAVGDSVAVNGVCLTVIELVGDHFAVEAVPETLKRTNLGSLAIGSPVNLERAVGEGRFFGGHYVQGHVDGTAKITSIVPDGEAKTYRFELEDPSLGRYLVEKGFVSVDGTSLTVVELGDDWFTATIIPHTQKAVVMGGVEPGYVVNIEVDVLGKYVERIVDARLASVEARLAALEGR
jgi:riboflavin synthase